MKEEIYKERNKRKTGKKEGRKEVEYGKSKKKKEKEAN